MLVYSAKSFLHSGFLKVLFLVCFLPGFSSCSSTKNAHIEMQARNSDLSIISTGSGPLLSEAIKNNQSKKEITPSRKSLLKLVTQKSSEAAYQTCLKQFKEAPECLYLKPDWNQNFFVDETAESDSADKEELALKVIAAKKNKTTKHRNKKGVKEVAINIRKGILDRSPNQQEGDYYRALKGFPTWSPELEALATKLQSEPVCAEIELYNYLGLKAEEFFPDDKMMKTSMSLYRKADECAQKELKPQPNRYVQNSRFRLGLLAILKDDCNEAQAVFNRLSKMGANDFSTRALYWSAYCSKADSKQKEYLATFDQLFKMNPLGFHTMSMTSGSSL